MVVSKATVVSDVFEAFYDRLSANVTSVNLSDGNIQTIQTYTSSFPDKPLDESSDYPILVINSSNIDWEDHTFTKKWVNGSTRIDIFTTKSEASDKFEDAIRESIETYRKDLRDAGLMFVNVDGTSKDEFPRGKIKVHQNSITFRWRYIFTKTKTY